MSSYPANIPLKVVFLDIDGVLITRKTCKMGYGIVERKCVDALNQLIEQTKAVIVLSSCWRVGRTIDECKELLSNWGVKGELLGRTYCSETLRTRGEEIKHFIKAFNHLIESFAIIDDDSDMDEYLPYLVKTNMVTGFTEKHIPKVINLLNNKLVTT